MIQDGPSPETRDEYDFKNNINRSTSSASKKNTKRNTAKTPKHKLKYEKDIYYPGFVTDNDWYKNALLTFRLPQNVTGFRNDYDYSAPITCEQFGLNSENLESIKKDFRILCSKELTRADALKAKEWKYNLLKFLWGINSLLNALFHMISIFGAVIGIGLLIDMLGNIGKLPRQRLFLFSDQLLYMGLHIF